MFSFIDSDSKIWNSVVPVARSSSNLHPVEGLFFPTDKKEMKNTKLCGQLF